MNNSVILAFSSSHTLTQKNVLMSSLRHAYAFRHDWLHFSDGWL